eukprot:SAG31_NODE_7615_length_1640_cov_1.562622_2_plen_410_part_01
MTIAMKVLLTVVAETLFVCVLSIDVDLLQSLQHDRIIDDSDHYHHIRTVESRGGISGQLDTGGANASKTRMLLGVLPSDDDARVFEQNLIQGDHDVQYDWTPSQSEIFEHTVQTAHTGGSGVHLSGKTSSRIHEDKIEPFKENGWNQSYRDQKVLRHLRRGQETRRRKLAEDSGRGIEQVTGCTDSLASNYDATAVVESGGCSYSCTSLLAHYFPDDSDNGLLTSECFLYDAHTESWPEVWMNKRTNATESVCYSVPGLHVFSDGSAPTLVKPSNENWLVQGRSNLVDGVALPVLLDARIESPRSNGSVVLRHLRISGHDVRGDRCAGICPDEKCGPVAFYFGIGGRGGIKLVFDHVVFDHNFGTAPTGDVWHVTGRNLPTYVGNTSMVEWNHIAWSANAHLGLDWTIVD